MTSARLLSHAALEIVHEGTRLLLDPWLQGTCYDEGWALLPEPPDAVARLERPDAVAFSHAHADHLHAPSVKALLARFGPELVFLVPRQVVDVSARALRAFGARHVHDVPLNETVTLGPNFTISFHACRADDSAQIVRAGSHTFVNANDCRIEGAWLDDLCRRAPNPTFYFGQFSFADGYPFCFDGLPEADLREALQEPLEQFKRQSRAFGARWGVPTASFVRFAHADNAHLNALARTPEEVVAACGDSVVAWYPGDGWSDSGGHITAPEHRAAYDRARQLQPQPPVTSDDPAFDGRLRAATEHRFRDMVRTIPSLVSRRLRPLGFHLYDRGVSLTVDLRSGRWHWHDGLPTVPYYRLRARHFLRIVESNWGWSTLHISARFTAHGWQDDDAIHTFMPVSTIYALGYFHVARSYYLRPSTLATLWRRRVEIADLIGRAVRGRIWSEKPIRRL